MLVTRRIEEGGVRRALPYRGEGLPVTFVWSRVGIGARELVRSILGFELDRTDVLAWLARST
jgi:hypothetical protein